MKDKNGNQESAQVVQKRFQALEEIVRLEERDEAGGQECHNRVVESRVDYAQFSIQRHRDHPHRRDQDRDGLVDNGLGDLVFVEKRREVQGNPHGNQQHAGKHSATAEDL